MIIRQARQEDAERIAEIYNPYIENTTVTYEYEKISAEDMGGRMKDIMEGYPFLVAEIDGLAAGYAYACRHYERAAYHWNCETSVYIAEEFAGRGIGSCLYERLIAILTSQVSPPPLRRCDGVKDTLGTYLSRWGFKPNVINLRMIRTLITE